MKYRLHGRAFEKVRNANGVTVGDIYDVFIKVAGEHNPCSHAATSIRLGLASSTLGSFHQSPSRVRRRRELLRGTHKSRMARRTPSQDLETLVRAQVRRRKT